MRLYFLAFIATALFILVPTFFTYHLRRNSQSK